jgi:tetratricopeptide (TPR) repeat protein
MIVKNEEKVIRRLLESVCTLIDSYCICDTGSTDNTIQVITEFFSEKNISGRIFEEQFQNFEYNRTKALHESFTMNCSHILLMDADMILRMGPDFDKTTLQEMNADVYHILQGTDTFFYKNARLVRCHPDVKYMGVTHEYLSYPDHFKGTDLDKSFLFIDDIGDGGSKSDKFQRDIQLLSKDVEEHPENVRSWFYLANSYRDVDNFEKAKECYLKRIELKNWSEEIWYSYYSLGKLCIKHGKFAEAIYYFMRAYEHNQNRFENIYQIIHYFRLIGQNHICKLNFDMYESKMKQQKKTFYNDLFCEKDIYTWRMDYEYTIFAYYVGIREIDMKKVMRIMNNCPEYWTVNSVIKNLKFYDLYLKPEKKFIFTKKRIREWKNKTFDNCSSSSMSLMDYDDTSYLMNMRIVNYYCTKNGSYEMEHNRVVTWNSMVFLNKETLDIVENYEYLKEPEQTVEHHLNGLEDVRIFRSCEKPDTIYYLATEYIPSDNSLHIVRGIYDVPSKSLLPLNILDSPYQSICEKNWVHCPFPNKDLIIYKWHPLQIFQLPSSSSSLTLFKEMETPRIFKDARGSSNGYKVGNEIWFVIHYVNYECPRDYYHSFVVLDAESLEILRSTPLLKFSSHCIEYCLGIIVRDDTILVTVSEMDRSSIILTYSKQKIESRMITERDLDV